MKDFNRIAHTGVKKDLVALRKFVQQKYPRVEIGSSGEGEITLKQDRKTVYARKYKIKDGWKVVECRGSKTLKVSYPESNTECYENVLKALN